MLCKQKDLVEVMELNLQQDHIHLVMSMPPKYALSEVMGYLKGKLSFRLFQKYENLGKRTGEASMVTRILCKSSGIDET